MDNQIPAAPQKKTAWLKYAAIAAFTLLLISIGLFFTKERFRADSPVTAEQTKEILFTRPGQAISRDEYTITFSNPRYEHLDLQSFFRVDVNLLNKSLNSAISIIANCDLEEGGKIVSEGVGVSIERGESRRISPNTSRSWTSMVVLDNKNQKVSSCMYSPEGVFDSSQTVQVVF